LFIAGWTLFGPVANAVMNAEAVAFPWKLDYSLYLIDRALGVSAFAFARQLLPRQRDILFVIYLTLGHWMIVWYALNLKIRNGRPKPLLLSYVIAYGLAPIFYLVVPACGPRHAFGGAFPMGNPQVAPVPIHLAQWPNAIPSLHFATAILFVQFAGKNRILQCVAWVYLVGTAAATLAFEHYVIDLVVAIPYAYFAISAAEGRFAVSLRYLGVTLAWLVSIRFATPVMAAHPYLLRGLALATLAVGAQAFASAWSMPHAAALDDAGPTERKSLIGLPRGGRPATSPAGAPANSGARVGTQ
jgi:hypothetical protein